MRTHTLDLGLFSSLELPGTSVAYQARREDQSLRESAICGSATRE